LRPFSRDRHFQSRHHHFNGDHGVVDQKAERDDQGAERNALQRDSGICHHHERDRQNQGDRDRNDQTGAKPRLKKLIPSTMTPLRTGLP
jgi:hypothetical protein